MKSLVAAIIEGDTDQSLIHTQHLVSSGFSAENIVINGIEAAMSKLDAKCTLEQFNLLEIMLSGRAVTEVMKLLYPSGLPGTSGKGKVVTVTLEGDVHDLGKNILKMILIANGYSVVDCGKDCPLQRFIETAAQERPKAVAISGLITPVIPQVKKVKDLLANHGLQGIKIIAGGAALKQSSPDKLNVDYVAESAFDALHYLEGLGAKK
ncbi:MAG: cobalamin-dependent protein [Chitinispirillaceae bacterium]